MLRSSDLIERIENGHFACNFLIHLNIGFLNAGLRIKSRESLTTLGPFRIFIGFLTGVNRMTNQFIVQSETLIPFASTPSQRLKNLLVDAAGTL